MNILLKALTRIPTVLFMLALTITVQARCQTVSNSQNAENTLPLSALGSTAPRPVDIVNAVCERGGEQAGRNDFILDAGGLCHPGFGVNGVGWRNFYQPFPSRLQNQAMQHDVNVCKHYKGTPITMRTSQFWVIQCYYPEEPEF
jgi:hypothetical protein